ncbi:stage V sporulation protein K [Seinonella peptonophila]|uniref:Stage V sporulation protein K n=1 Tax=Seinonella peptonophila TaxID=112248 RepID=A0A1M4T1X1_9BACL|nr:AAA family ATPase [Seinonella peptonophila]SHE38390.1 stage V sporulation protein K [Seinonella peptonophila]
MSRVVMSEKETKHRIQILFDSSTSDEVAFIEDTQTKNTWKEYPTTDLERLIGLEKVKRFIHEIYAWLEIGRRRTEAGLLTEQQVLHMVFTGNPGTGKTTVARIMAQLLQKMGILSKGHLVEVERADLVGEYIGHTAQRTREQVKRALGGILFIDEAYSLARGGDKDFGKEAIDTLVKSMEDFKNDFILILAGYSIEMNHFLSSNPGLPSRFPIQLHFPDFTLTQLMQIAEQMLEERQYLLTPVAKEKLELHLLDCKQKHQTAFGNARYVRNLLERSIRKQAVRLFDQLNPSREELMSIRAVDLVLQNE